ncbi:MAG: hypothetical protein M0Q38_10970 [Bacteroidales bacterium]|jgi:hypothetical protein|nr:hypothetical protein [Bacteroidales bacterium]
MRRFYFVITATLLLITLNSFSQNSKKWQVDFQIGADLMSRYIWRGLDLGGAGPSIQPTLKLNVGNSDHMFSVGAWGAYTFGPTSNQEVDLIASYTFKSLLTLMVTDYFFPGLYTGHRDQYFYYRQDSTGHVFEGMIMFNGTANIPFTLMVATNFYGNDAGKMKQVNDTTLRDDGIQYSTYIELGFKKRIKGFDFNAFVGGTVNNPDTDRDETGYYGNCKAGFTNIGIKVAKGIPVTEKYSIPIQVSLIANPMQNKFYMVFGMSF